MGSYSFLTIQKLKKFTRGISPSKFNILSLPIV